MRNEENMDYIVRGDRVGNSFLFRTCKIYTLFKITNSSLIEGSEKNKCIFFINNYLATNN